MTHDPLCPQATIYSGEWEPDQRHWSCHCDLIAKVRVDERNRCIAEVETLGPLQQFRARKGEDGYLIRSYETVDVGEVLRQEASWILTHRITTGPIRRITP